jgi:hypothetical protein
LEKQRQEQQQRQRREEKNRQVCEVYRQDLNTGLVHYLSSAKGRFWEWYSAVKILLGKSKSYLQLPTSS